MGDPSVNRVLIKNGTVVHENRTAQEDILIEDGVIAMVAPDLLVPNANTQVIDATNHYVMPGGIDVHTHFNIDVGIARSCDDFYTGTVSAACGGTTTIIDHMGFGPEGCSLHHQLNRYHADAKNSVIDYSFHGVIQHINDSILDEMADMVHVEGISSFKMYLTYQFKLDDAAVLKALYRLESLHALTTVHPENDAAIAFNKAMLTASNKTAPIDHAKSRPLECEAEAIARMINLAKIANNAPLYIVHLSNGLGLEYIKLAKKAGQSVWVETCPHYLLLNERCYERPDALKYIASPPLRAASECDKLWNGIVDGSIDTVATDHCAFTWPEQKNQGHPNVNRCPNGMPGVEVRMPLLFSAGVMQNRISPSRFVLLTSTQPAKLFGLYPQKGCIAVGSDGDIVLFDQREHKTVLKHALLHDKAGYTPFEDFVMQGWPTMTLSRGKIVAHKGKFLGQAGFGRFIPRKPFLA